MEITMSLIFRFSMKIYIVFTYVINYVSYSHKSDNTCHVCSQGLFFAILGRGPRAILIGKINDIHHNLGNVQNIQS